MIKILASELYKAVKTVKRTDYSRFPVLNYALLKITDDGYLTVTTTNLEKPLTAKASCIWDEPLETCAPMIVKADGDNGKAYQAKKGKCYPFMDWLKVMADYKELLVIEHDKRTESLTIKAGSSRTTFKCIDAQEFPRS